MDDESRIVVEVLFVTDTQEYSESVPVEAVHARKEDVEHGDRRGRREREVAVARHQPRRPV